MFWREEMSEEFHKKRIKYRIWFGFWCLLLFFAGRMETFAAVTEGRPGETAWRDGFRGIRGDRKYKYDFRGEYRNACV